MLTIQFSLVAMTLVFKGATGVSVMQTQGPMTVSEGEGLRLNCSYDDAAVYAVFWYVQFPSQHPRLLLRDLGRENSDEGIRKGFDATHDKKLKSFHLWKASGEVSDSATYYCAASDTVTRTGRELSKNRAGSVRSIGKAGTGVWEGKGEAAQSQNLDQVSLWPRAEPRSAQALEGAELNLTCSHPAIKASDSTVWYRELPNTGPEFVVSGYKETTKTLEPAGALHISVDRESSSLALRRGQGAGFSLCGNEQGSLWVDTIKNPFVSRAYILGTSVRELSVPNYKFTDDGTERAGEVQFGSL
ncbi:uncharacterized protein LOC122456408 [Dermochelys coriacea]|uniref:uncharacterized protein LOC122456408 n=1 Tax=Dermochelys coriacea TaxID=27794 RepID=UPI001CA90F4C|nr:uncharacterized protein LOC122456408 [Dermochelys coriacea]